VSSIALRCCGIIVSLVICVPAALHRASARRRVIERQPVHGGVVLAVLVLAGLVVGATIAARQRRSMPRSSGIVTAIVTFVLVQDGVLRRFATSEDVSWSRILSAPCSRWWRAPSAG
jgi:uncharacterized membrane protein